MSQYSLSALPRCATSLITCKQGTVEVSSNSTKLHRISRDGAISATEAPNALSRVRGADNQKELSRNPISDLGLLGRLTMEEELMSTFLYHPELLLGLDEMGTCPLTRGMLLNLPLQRCNTTMKPSLYLPCLC